MSKETEVAHEAPAPQRAQPLPPAVEQEASAAERSRAGLRAEYGAHDPAALWELPPRDPASDAAARSRAALDAAVPEAATVPRERPAPPERGGRGPREAAVPGLHQTHVFVIKDFGGDIGGELTATLELGKTGIPVGDGDVKLLADTTTRTLRGRLKKLETALLSGEATLAELGGGVSITIDAAALSVTRDHGGDLETELMTIGVNVVGDASSLLGLGPNVSLKVQGRLTVSLSGPLATRLARFTATQLELASLTREIEDVTEQLNHHGARANALDAKIAKQGGLASKEVSEELLQHRFQVSYANQQLDRLEKLQKRLVVARQRGRAALVHVQGAIGKQVARAMERKAVRMVARALMKLVPVLNVISTIVDVVEAVQLIRQLLKGEFGEGGGDGGEATAGGDSVQAQGPSGAAAGAVTRGARTEDASSGTAGAAGQAREPEADLAAARAALHPAARAIVDGLTQHAPTGVQLNRAVLTKLGLLIPPDLTAEELAQALAQLRANSRARTAAEVIASVDETVRRVRSGGPAETPHPRADAARATDTQGGSTRRGGTGGFQEGPVTSPKHVEADDAWSLVHEFDAHDAGAWFEERDGELVMTDAGKSWIAQHQGADVGDGVVLRRVIHATHARGPGRWDLTVTFVLGHAGKTQLEHGFFVENAGRDDGFGAKVGDLKFEGYHLLFDVPVADSDS